MDILEIIMNRRSIRQYNGQEISNEVLEKLCEAGLAAPSARNARPWEFFIIKDREKLIRLSKIRAYWKMLPDAAAAIVIAGVKDDYFEQNCAAAAENILLAAEGMGVGGVWLGLYPNMEAVRETAQLLGCPEEVTPFSVISLGYPKESGKPAARALEKNKIHFEKWD